MTLQSVLKELHAHRGAWRIIALRTRVPRRTIEKISAGVIKSPGVRTIEKLATYFQEKAVVPDTEADLLVKDFQGKQRVLRANRKKSRNA
jgi:hypothetical protein